MGFDAEILNVQLQDGVQRRDMIIGLMVDQYRTRLGNS